jgi:predicted SprT family Zn-dependent metalloprotease
MNVIGAALEELYRIFGILNRDKFNGELTEPVITIQKTRGRTLGHFTLDRTWRDKNNEESEETSYYEINVDPRWFNSRTPADVAETLLHEMCHYHNKVNDIKDCSGNVHNKKFKASAEKVGLVVEKGKGVGYGYTSMSEALEAYMNEVVKPNEEAFEYFRSTPVKPSGGGGGGGRKKSIFKYTCPDCGAEVKGKRDMTIKCGICDVVMKMENVESED